MIHVDDNEETHPLGALKDMLERLAGRSQSAVGQKLVQGRLFGRQSG